MEENGNEANEKGDFMAGNKTMKSLMMWSIVVLLSAQGLMGQSKDESFARAERLRNQSGARWDAGEFLVAAKELREADSIYQRLGAAYVGQRLKTLRALIFHESSAGEIESVLASVDTLAKLVAKDKDKAGELQWAFTSAVVQILNRKIPYDKALKVMEHCRSAFKKNRLGRLEALSWHHQGGLEGDNQHWDDMESAFRTAIGLRKNFQDKQDLAWSYNSLASYLIEAGRLDSAMVPFENAESLMSEGVLEHEAAMALNLESLIKSFEELEKVTRQQVSWLWDLAERRAAHERPRVIPVDFLLRSAAELAVRNKRNVTSAVRRLTRVTLDGAPEEVRTDLQLRAARLASDHGKGKLALTILKKAKSNGGLCAPLTQARISLEKSLALIAIKDKKKLPSELKTTRSLYQGLKSRGLEEDALKVLVAAFSRWPESPLAAQTKSAYDALRRNGIPGGDGASASVQRPSKEVTDLSAHEAVFRIYASDDGKIILEDIFSGAKTKMRTTWKPKKQALNGCSVEFFGGYIRVIDMNYGRTSRAAGTPSPGTMTLDLFKNYVPIPKGGGIEVTKSGATRFFRD